MNLWFHCTFRCSVHDLQYLIRILIWLVVLIQILTWLAVLIQILTWLVVLKWTLTWLTVKNTAFYKLHASGSLLTPMRTFTWVYFISTNTIMVTTYILSLQSDILCGVSSQKSKRSLHNTFGSGFVVFLQVLWTCYVYFKGINVLKADKVWVYVPKNLCNPENAYNILKIM